MVEIWLPYGTSDIPVRVAEERLVDIITPKANPLPDPIVEAKKLIETNQSFKRRAQEAKNICVALSSCGTVPLVLGLIRALREFAGTQVPFTVICTEEDTALDFNQLPNTRITLHQSASSVMQPVDKFKGDFPLEVNSDFINADLKIIVGELKPHPFLQTSGLCDAIFPGLASAKAVQGHLTNRTGISAMDLHKERTQITELFGDTYALGALLDLDKAPLHLAFGTIQEALAILQKAMTDLISKTVLKTADIVVISAGGSPQDESLLQAIETFPTGISALKKNGVLIVAAECGKGHGDTEFYEWTAERKEPHHLEARLRHHYNYNGFKAAYLSRTLKAHRIYLSSTIPDYYVENIFGMKAAVTVNAALQTAQRTIGSDATVSVIPDASRVLLKQQPPAQ